MKNIMVIKRLLKLVLILILLSYKDLLENYWINIDPFDGEGQFCDRGNSYKPIIFTSNKGQESEAKESKENIFTIIEYTLGPIKG